VEAIEAELLRRRNGDAPTLDRRLTGPNAPKRAGGSNSTATRNGQEPDQQPTPESPTTKVCLRRGEAKPVAEFPDATRNTCRECKARRARERREASRAPADHEPRPAPRTRDRGSTLIPHAEVADAEARRSLLAGLRANGVEVEERDGREFTVWVPNTRSERANRSIGTQTITATISSTSAGGAHQRLRWHLHQLDPTFVVPAKVA
jgi:hypothetical protein